MISFVFLGAISLYAYPPEVGFAIEDRSIFTVAEAARQDMVQFSVTV